MKKALLYGFEKAISFHWAKVLMSKIEQIEYLSDEELDWMTKACQHNNQINKSFGVPERIEALKKKIEIPF